MKISLKLVLPIHGNFLYFSLTTNHLYPLQVGNCDSNSRLVVDEDDNGKFRLERVKVTSHTTIPVEKLNIYASNIGIQS